MSSPKDRERPALSKQLPFSLSESDYERVRALAEARRVSMAHVVRDLLRHCLPAAEAAYADEASALDSAVNR